MVDREEIRKGIASCASDRLAKKVPNRTPPNEKIIVKIGSVSGNGTIIIGEKLSLKVG